MERLFQMLGATMRRLSKNFYAIYSFINMRSFLAHILLYKVEESFWVATTKINRKIKKG